MLDNPLRAIHGASSLVGFDQCYIQIDQSVAFESKHRVRLRGLRARDFDQAIALAEGLAPSFRKEERLLALGLAEQVWGLAIGHRNLASKGEADAHLAAALEVMDLSEQRLLAAIGRLEWAHLCRRRGDASQAAALRAQGVAQFEAADCAHLIEGVEHACRLD